MWILDCKNSMAKSKHQINHQRDKQSILARARFHLIIGFSILLAHHDAEAGRILFNDPPANLIDLKAGVMDSIPTWTSSDRIVMTPYFYWYDVWTQSHLLNPDHSDALTTHPVTLSGFSYKSMQWHKTQLSDMEAAGIDVVLPVYWGDPSQLTETGDSHWSYAGIPPLVAAREELLKEGRSPPRIGMFYDTTTLERNAWNEHVDLTTSRGQSWYYESVRDYFSLVPPQHWAMINHCPIIFTWVSTWAKAYDQTHVSEAKRRFGEDFGGYPFYLIKERSWDIEADDVYAWGGALGLKPLSVASIGPGYDHSNVPDRPPFKIDRESGAFFERNWERLLRTGIDRVMIETWNEYHEGTDISHSHEYGRTYIDINRHYADLFKSRFIPPPIDGRFSNVSSISTDFTEIQGSEAIQWIDWSDGPSELIVQDGALCRTYKSDPDFVSYLYFRVHDSFRWQGARDLKLCITAEVGPDTEFDVQFDGSDSSAPLTGGYTSSPPSRRNRISSTLSEYVFDLKDARFLNSQNGGADFRIRKLNGDLCIRALEIIKVPDIDSDVGMNIEISIENIVAHQLTIRVHGQPSTRYVVESSRDLVVWSALSSVFIASNQRSGDVQVANRWPVQYFRVRND